MLVGVITALKWSPCFLAAHNAQQLCTVQNDDDESNTNTATMRQTAPTAEGSVCAYM